MTTRERLFTLEKAANLFEREIKRQGHTMVGWPIELPLRDGHVDEYIVLGLRRLPGGRADYSTWIGCIDDDPDPEVGRNVYLISGHYDIPTLVEAVRDIEGRQ